MTALPVFHNRLQKKSYSLLTIPGYLRHVHAVLFSPDIFTFGQDQQEAGDASVAVMVLYRLWNSSFYCRFGILGWYVIVTTYWNIMVFVLLWHAEETIHSTAANDVVYITIQAFYCNLETNFPYSFDWLKDVLTRLVISVPLKKKKETKSEA